MGDVVPADDDDALRRSAAMFAKALIDDIARREGAITPQAIAEIKARVVEEVRARHFAKDVTPKDNAE